MIMRRRKIRKIVAPYLRPVVVPIRKAMYQPGNEKKLQCSREHLKSLHNVHLGERCFIVGSGPSLTTEDLAKLKSEYSFGMHQIYNIFPRTDWRPTYYCAMDGSFIRNEKRKIEDLIKGETFIGLNITRKYPYFQNVNYLELTGGEFYPNLPKFSNDILQGVYTGCTVTYMALQIAVYMGFEEIILLGVDHNYSSVLDESGNIVNTDVRNYFSETGKVYSLPELFKTTLAYEAAKKYADEHGIKIYNATRGGKLEVFERVNFDDLFQK